MTGAIASDVRLRVKPFSYLSLHRSLPGVAEVSRAYARVLNLPTVDERVGPMGVSRHPMAAMAVPAISTQGCFSISLSISI